MHPTETEKAQHTAEPWQHNATKPIDGYTDGLACAVWSADERPIATTDFSVGRWKALSPEEQDANAKRIVACVNACASIPDPASAVPALVGALEGLYANARCSCSPSPKAALCVTCKAGRLLSELAQGGKR